MLNEFKAFALKGNVVDLAVGVMIGGAFGKIVSSLVNDVLMPGIGLFLGGVNLTNLKLVIRPAHDGVAEVAILYGAFIQSIVDFLIIALSLFVFIKVLLAWRKKEPVSPPPPPAPTEEVILLKEIRDVLKEKSSM